MASSEGAPKVAEGDSDKNVSSESKLQENSAPVKPSKPKRILTEAQQKQFTTQCQKGLQEWRQRKKNENNQASSITPTTPPSTRESSPVPEKKKRKKKVIVIDPSDSSSTEEEVIIKKSRKEKKKKRRIIREESSSSSDESVPEVNAPNIHYALAHQIRRSLPSSYTYR